MAFNFNNFNPKHINTIKDNVIKHTAKLVFNGVVVWLEKVLTTLTGYPVTLINSTGEDLVDYKIEGNSIQDGTPTPDAPIEIESVGDKTSNLFDNDISVTNVSKEGNDIIVKAYAAGTGIKPSQFLEMTGLKIGDKFTIKRSFTVEKGTASTVTGAIRFLKADGSSDYFALIGGSDKVKTVTIPEDFNDDTYSSLYFYGVSTAENGQRLVRFSNVQIAKGSYTNSTMPKYEPYGYRIPITVRGKNLLDKSLMYKQERKNIAGLNWIYDDEKKSYIANGTQTAQLSSYALFIDSSSVVKQLKNGHKYMLIGNQKSNNTKELRYYVFASHKSGSKTVYISSDLENNTFVYTDGDTLSFDLRIYSVDGVLRDIENVVFQPMLIDITGLNDDTIVKLKTDFEEYIEPITTNIYLDEPLRKVGDYADYLDFESGKVIRDIAYKKITASSITQKSSVSTENFNYYFISFSGAMVGREIPILSNIGGYPNKQLNDKNREGIFSNTNTTFFIAFFDITTLADAKQFVTDNEVYVNYILATPKEETIQLPNIPTHKGTTIIELDTTVLPSNMEVKYYSRDSETIELTAEQIEAIENMTSTISNDLVLEYDDEVLNIDFEIKENNLIVTNNVEGIDFNINENNELEVKYGD